jgi:hypothetical protein
MPTRSTIIAAFSLAAATILAVAACGTSVSGSAQPNPAAESVSIPSSLDISLPSDLETPTELPTDLDELTSMLGDLPTGGDVPTDLGDLNSLLENLPTGDLPTDLGDLGDLTNLNIPGYDSACLSVPFAYASIGLSTLGALTGGDGDFDSAGLTKAVSEFAAAAPPELAGTAQALTELAAEADGKTNAEAIGLLDGEVYTQASKDIEAWMTTNCGG